MAPIPSSPMIMSTKNYLPSKLIKRPQKVPSNSKIISYRRETHSKVQEKSNYGSHSGTTGPSTSNPKTIKSSYTMIMESLKSKKMMSTYSGATKSRRTSKVQSSRLGSVS